MKTLKCLLSATNWPIKEGTPSDAGLIWGDQDAASERAVQQGQQT